MIRKKALSMAGCEDAIGDIREFNRFYTNILGLLDRHMLDSDFSLTEARVLYELNAAGRCIANELSVRLQVDKSYLSRILAGFERKGLVRREASPDDSRASAIELTAKGKRAFLALSEKSNRQIGGLLDQLSAAECAQVRAAMDTIRRLFSKARDAVIRPFTDADVPFVIHAQIELYDREYGFTSPVWKSYVSDAVHRLVERFDPSRDAMWILEYRGVPSGCIAVAHAEAETAQLRFFFLDASVRGLGLGGRLMELAVAFCREKKYRHAFLLTSDKLAAARYLYRKHGFALTESRLLKDWGETFVEERWDMDLIPG